MLITVNSAIQFSSTNDQFILINDTMTKIIFEVL